MLSRTPHREPTIRRLDPLGEHEWDALLDRCDGATVFHRSAWLRVLQSTYGFAPAGFVCETDGPPTLLPLMEVSSLLTGRRGVSLPFTDECAPLVDHGTGFTALFQSLCEHGRARRWRYVELRGGRSLFELAPAAVTFAEHELPLSRDTKRLFDACHSSAQWAVRKAARSGVTVAFAQDLASVRTFYGLLCQTRQRQGIPPQPFRFFENIQRLILAAGAGFVCLAFWQQTPVAGAVYFQSGRTAIYKFSASDDSFQHLRPNNLVMWRSIERLAETGVATLDFGRTSLGNEGLRRFKLSWGATERPLEYVRFDLQKDAFVTSPDRSTGWHNRLFRRLPLPLARLAGQLLYRHAA